jgi:hypothetical protein
MAAAAAALGRSPPSLPGRTFDSGAKRAANVGLAAEIPLPNRGGDATDTSGLYTAPLRGWTIRQHPCRAGLTSQLTRQSTGRVPGQSQRSRHLKPQRGPHPPLRGAEDHCRRPPPQRGKRALPRRHLKRNPDAGNHLSLMTAANSFMRLEVGRIGPVPPLNDGHITMVGYRSSALVPPERSVWAARLRASRVHRGDHIDGIVRPTPAQRPVTQGDVEVCEPRSDATC